MKMSMEVGGHIIWKSIASVVAFLVLVFSPFLTGRILKEHVTGRKT